MSTICSSLSNQAVELAVDKYPHLQDLKLADIPAKSSEIEVNVLIGVDYYWDFFTGTVRRGGGGGGSQGPVALKTNLGWVVSGPVVLDWKRNPEWAVNINTTHVLRVDTSPVQEENEINEQLIRFWDLETLGIQKDETSVYDKFIEEVKFDGKKYEATLPFKEDHPVLPDNYFACQKRLGSLLRRLQAKPDVLREHKGILEEQISGGIVELVPEKEMPPPGSVHYLLHREVIRMDKETTKLRVVYDASARGAGPSLNDCLYAGPPLSPFIFDILVRFRLHKVAVAADIEKAFLNISITPEHRDYLRFLWVNDPFEENPSIRLMRFTRVVFEVTSSPFILNATIRHHLNQYAMIQPDIVKELLRSLYVDDIMRLDQDLCMLRSSYVRRLGRSSQKADSTCASGSVTPRKS